MINAKEKLAQDALNAKVQEASSKLDSVLAGMTGADAKAAARALSEVAEEVESKIAQQR
jgi:hypothetical protein